MKKIASLFITAALTLTALSSCVSDLPHESDTLTSDITVTVKNTTLSAALNTVGDYDAIIYDRNYVINSLYLPETINNYGERDVMLVLSSVENGSTIYYVYGNSYGRLDNTIPVNGFLLSVKKGTIELRNGIPVTFTNYDIPESESVSYGTIRIGTLNRRIYLCNPENIIPEENIICLFTPDNMTDITIPEGCSAYSLSMKDDASGKASELLTETIPASTYAIVFSGPYNMAFASEFMTKGASVTLKKLDCVYSDTYKPFFEYKNKSEPILSLNAAPEKDGVYVYDANYPEMTIPEPEGDFLCAIVKDNTVIYVGDKNKSLVVPTGDSYAVLFAGEAAKKFSGILFGQTLSAKLIKLTTDENKSKGFELHYTFNSASINAFNSTRDTDYLVVYDTGKTTGTNVYGYEIAVDSNGKMIESSYTGNMAIPQGGFVLSGHGTAEAAMETLYVCGAEAVVDKTSRKLYTFTTPLTKEDAVKDMCRQLKQKYTNSLASYKDFDYDGMKTALDEADVLLSGIDALIESGDIAQAMRDLSVSSEKLESCKLTWLSNQAAENRMAWYAPMENSDASVESTVKLAKQLGLNAIYIETWRGGETIYPTEVKWARQSAGFSGYDVLEGFVRIGHEYGIEIHCWVHNFFIGITADMSDSEHITSLTKQYHLVTRSGCAYNPTQYGNFVFLDPYTRECRDFVLDLYKEMITKYDIDGLHLDYMRYPEPNNYSTSSRDDFGYNDDIIAGFKAEYNTNVDPHNIYPGDKLWNDWCLYRERIINTFVTEVYDLVSETEPDLWISCAVFTDLSSVRQTIFQNCIEWINKGQIDEVFTMAYSSSVDYVVENTQDFISQIDDKCFYSVGLGAFQEYDEYIYVTQVEALRELKIDGNAIFSLASVRGNTLNTYLSSSVFKEASVQTYKLEKTLSAQMDSLIKRCSGIFTLANTTVKNLDLLKDKFTNVKDYCDAFDSYSASVQDKLDFIAEAISKLENIDISFGDDSLDDAITGEVAESIDCLKRL
ncbi:MAG TPA: family 10 glycosylhydrolase, partial [Bacillota bacterium]|nr:family 10 glycosylhydrolase [Bacillota bacterium]